MIRNVKRLFLYISIAMLTSCSGLQRKLAERKLDKAVAVLGASESIEIIANKHGLGQKKTDSLVVYKEKVLRDTLIVPIHDTLEKIITKKDVEVRIRRVRDTIQVQAKCKDTSVYVQRITGLEKAMESLKYRYEQEILKEKQKNLNKTKSIVLLIVVSIVVLFILLFLYRVMSRLLI